MIQSINKEIIEMIPEERIKEFENMSEEEKRLLNDIMGKSNYFSIEALIFEFIEIFKKYNEEINKQEELMKLIKDTKQKTEIIDRKYSDEEIYNLISELSDKFLEFLFYIDYISNHKSTFPSYVKHMKDFDYVFNSDIDLKINLDIFYDESNNNEEINKIVKERMEVLIKTECNLISLFENVEKYKDIGWNRFEKILKTNI